MIAAAYCPAAATVWLLRRAPSISLHLAAARIWCDMAPPSQCSDWRGRHRVWRQKPGGKHLRRPVLSAPAGFTGFGGPAMSPTEHRMLGNRSTDAIPPEPRQRALFEK